MEIIDTFGNYTEEWQEAQMKYGGLKGDLERRISLSIGFKGKGGINNSDGERGMLNSKDLEKSGINRKLPGIWEEGGVGESAISLMRSEIEQSQK